MYVFIQSFRLITAAENEDVDAMQQLFSIGANVNYTDGLYVSTKCIHSDT